MITPGADLKVYVATRPVDFRKGHDGLAALVQQMFGLDPFSGAAFVFRANARLNASNTNLRVPAAGPVHEQNRLIGVLIEIANNLSHHDVNQPLLGACVRGWCIPNPWQIMRKLQKQGAVDLGSFHRCGAQLLDPTLKLGNPLQCTIPARLELTGNVTFRRIHKLVSACGKRRFVACAFKLPFDGGDDLLSRALNLVGRQYRCFNSPIGDGLKDLQRDRTIDPHSADADT